MIDGARALRAVLDEALGQGDDVHVLGEALELSPVTQGLMALHPERVHLLPASDAGLIGVAVGLAMAGKRAVVELADADALWGALQQLGQEAGLLRDRGEFTAPIVVRVPIGPGEADPSDLLQGLRGVSIASASTPADLANNLRLALDSSDPVVLLEPRSVLAARGEATPPEPAGACVRRSGEHATVLCWGAEVGVALAAAERLGSEGISTEVVDLRWLRPLDTDVVATSIRKTGRPVIAGAGAAVLLDAVRAAFLRLESPPAEALGSVDAVADAVRAAVHY